MNIIHAIIFGIVEGITEFLPISSTAHLDITRSILGIIDTPFVKSFEITIQLGAILAIVVLYFKKIFSSFKYFKNIVIAFIPTAIIGFLLYKIIKNVFLGNTLLEAMMLLLGGIIILCVEKKRKFNSSDENGKNIENLSNKELITLGLAQSLAVIPGVSRSGAVIVAGRLMKISPVIITEFSFLLAIPTMLAATLYDLLKSGFYFSKDDWSMLFVGFITSFIIALFIVKSLLNYIRTHSFSIFGWYRITLGLIVIFTLLFI